MLLKATGRCVCLQLNNSQMLVTFPTEEVLLTYAAHWWCLDGARLAYRTISNTATPMMEIPHFLGGLYPSNMVFPYPKVTPVYLLICECQIFNGECTK